MIPFEAMLDELRDRERTGGSLFEFAWRVALRDIPDRVPSLHHAMIAKRLEGLWLTPEQDDLYVGLPPRSGKTIYCSYAFVAWILGQDPRARIIIACSTTERAELLTGRVRDLVASDEYRRIFPDTRLNPTSLARGLWATTAGGSVLGAGVGKAIQGAPATLFIIDDPYASVEDAFSETIRASYDSWFTGTARTRMEPGGKMVLVCQRMHRADAAGRMMDNFAAHPEGRQLDTLILPAECEDPATDPLGRARGELLWPAHHDLRYLAPHRENPMVWRTLYQQAPPSDDGDWLDGVRYEPNPIITSAHRLYMASDCADSVGRGDYTVHMVIAHDRGENLFYVIDMFRGQVDASRSAEEFLTLYAHWRPIECLVENDVFTRSMMSHVTEQGRRKNLMPHIREYPSGGKSKSDKAGSFRGMMLRGMWRFDPAKAWTGTIIHELQRFPGATGAGVDDCVDCLSLMGRHLARTGTAAQPAPPPKPLPNFTEMTLDGLSEGGLYDLNGGGRSGLSNRRI